MCNIAGYVGSKPAAPILIEMMRREEGWNAGFYTGIATIHDGKIHYAKLTGDLNHLLENTDAASLPGTIGVIHSHTASGGGDKWSHPFIGEFHGEALTAYAANGSRGCFSDRATEATAIAAQLEAEGWKFRSRESYPIGLYPPLPDGGSAHMSDVMAQLITRNIVRGHDASTAMDRAFCEMPSEIVGLLLSVNEPSSIAWSRINMPMFVGKADHGVYLASTPQAFPEDADKPELLPELSGGRVYQNGYFYSKPYQNPPCTVAPITLEVLFGKSGVYSMMQRELKESPKTMPQLNKLAKELFDRADCVPSAAVVYRFLYMLERDGRLEITAETRPGMREDLTAPLFYASLK